MQLEIAKIRRDGGTQPRAQLSEETVEDYAADMRNGDVFRPVTVFFDGAAYWLADGFHRVEAMLRLKRDGFIEADVHQGTLEDAQWHSFSVNKTHGMRRTNVDKSRAIRAALVHPRSVDKSDAAIAEHVGVHRDTVMKYRHQMKCDVRQNVTTDCGDCHFDLQETGKSNHSTAPDDATVDVHPVSKTHPDLTVPKPSTRRRGRDGRTINTTNIGKTTRRKCVKPRSPTEFAAARQEGYLGPISSSVKIRLPRNHVYNCAFDLLRYFTFEYLQKVFHEVVNIHQQQLQKESPQ